MNMNRYLRRILDRIVAAADRHRIIRKDSFYRFQARRNGVQFIGIFERNGMALFQDPLTGSSFAIAKNEAVEAGIRRVRARFGISD